jgi:hypothetical protein
MSTYFLIVFKILKWGFVKIDKFERRFLGGAKTLKI